MDPDGKPSDGGLELPAGSGEEQPPPEGAVVAPAPKSEEKDAAEIQKRRRLEQAGIKVMPAAQRFARLASAGQGLAWPALCMPGGVESVWRVGVSISLPSFLLSVALLFPTWSNWQSLIVSALQYVSA